PGRREPEKGRGKGYRFFDPIDARLAAAAAQPLCTARASCSASAIQAASAAASAVIGRDETTPKKSGRTGL
ncbi:MAG: hypothetical protein ACO31E_09565, partial [Phycisphaerales bacterium]